MKYIKVTFIIENCEEYKVEMITYALGEVGFDSFQEISLGLNAYCAETLYSEQTMIEAINELPIDIDYKYRVEEVADINWNKTWEESFRSMIIDNRVVVHSTKHNLTEEEQALIKIKIDPSQSFGTGTHETTQMMVQYILDSNMSQCDVLDMGCGTGVLGILASMQGAKSVTAIDIDKWSYDNTILNAQLNSIENIKPILGDASNLLCCPNSFDVILANINRNILLQDFDKYVSSLKQGGKLFISGFYVSDKNILIEKAQSLGLNILSEKENNEWKAIAFVK